MSYRPEIVRGPAVGTDSSTAPPRGLELAHTAGLEHLLTYRLREALAVWLAEMRSTHTRSAYSSDLRSFLRWADSVALPDVLTATPEDLREWALELEEAELSDTTKARRIAAVRSFYRFAADTGRTHRDPAERIRAPRVDTLGRTQPLSLGEARELLRTAREHSQEARALVALLLLSALRVSEAVTARGEDLETHEEHRVLRVKGKGSRTRLVPLSPAALELLEPVPASGVLLRRGNGEELSRFAAGRLLAQLCKRTGLEPVSCHKLRHTAATLALDSGADVQRVADLLGHSSPTTTQRYVKHRDQLRSSASYVLGSQLS